jgi:hypothetical protein
MKSIVSRGMVQTRGVTYRVERRAPHSYAVVRLLDDAPMGSFRTLPRLSLEPVACEDQLFAEIVKTALRFARTSGVMRAVMPPPAPAAAQRSPSSMPPGPVLA